MTKLPETPRVNVLESVTIIVLALVVSGCGGNPRSMAGEEVRVLFTGSTVSGYHEKNGYDFVSYYESSVFRSYQDGSRTPRRGHWRVDSTGDICIRWQAENEDLCRTMFTDDRGNYWKVLVKADGAQIRIVTFDSFEPGNPNSL